MRNYACGEFCYSERNDQPGSSSLRRSKVVKSGLGMLAAAISLIIYQTDALALNVLPLHTFGIAPGDGADPEGGLTRRGGFLWGTTCAGGSANLGTIYRFQISNPSNYGIYHDFTGAPDGFCPSSDLTLVQGGGSTLYGTTDFGGNFSGYQGGTLFKILASGSFAYQRIYSFNGMPSDGSVPHGQLIYKQGLLWGTTERGGTSDIGTVFNAPLTGGTDTLFYSFQPPQTGDGSVPFAGLTYVANTNTFYGVTAKPQNRAFKYGSQGYQALQQTGESRTKLIKIGTSLYGGTATGTIFKLSQSGNVNVLYTFNGYPTDGDDVWGDIVYADIGHGPRIYGTTQAGGANDMGAVFEIDLAGNETDLYSFTGGADGAGPRAGLQVATVNGQTVIYGTTSYGAGTGCGGYGCGTVFQLQ
jgi:uncharacterized repeat protein (TIGR03803 family)